MSNFDLIVIYAPQIFLVSLGLLIGWIIIVIIEKWRNKLNKKGML